MGSRPQNNDQIVKIKVTESIMANKKRIFHGFRNGSLPNRIVCVLDAEWSICWEIRHEAESSFYEAHYCNGSQIAVTNFIEAPALQPPKTCCTFFLSEHPDNHSPPPHPRFDAALISCVIFRLSGEAKQRCEFMTASRQLSV